MKALKITLALLAIAMLTVSGVKSDDVASNEEPTYKTKTNYDLLAHNKDKLKLKSKG